MFGNKEEQARELGRLQGENELLKSQVEFLKEQVKDMQESLMAKQSPESYQLKKEIEYAMEANDGVEPSKNKGYLDEQRVAQEFMNMQEGSLFRNPQDLHDLRSRFTQGIGAPESDALAENDES